MHPSRPIVILSMNMLRFLSVVLVFGANLSFWNSQVCGRPQVTSSEHAEEKNAKDEGNLVSEENTQEKIEAKTRGEQQDGSLSLSDFRPE